MTIRQQNIVGDGQREGIAIVKSEGEYLGRRSILTEAQIQKMRNRAAASGLKAAIARDFGISHETFYQKLKG